MKTVQYSCDDCITALREAADELGKSPTYKEYKSLDISPSAATIENRLGSWNNAKEAAGLDRIAPGRKAGWGNVEQKRDAATFYIEHKESAVCAKCGEGDPRVLQYHHDNPATKSGSIPVMVQNGATIDEIKKEMEKCTVLCANCHWRNHKGWPPEIVR